MVISRPQTATSLLYTLSCKDDSWATTAKKLIDDIPVLLRSDDVKDVQKVLSVVFKSLPNNFWELIKLVVEVRREETDDSSLKREERERLHIKEEVLKLVKETKLFQQVMEWMCSASLCCTNIPSKADNSTSLDTAPSDFFQEAESLTKNLDLLDRFSHNSTSNTCNGDMPSLKVSRTERTGKSEERMNLLVPSCEINSCTVPANCIETHDARGDGLTALLLALPPHTWLGIKDEKLLEEMCSFVSTDSLPPLLQEEVLYLRKQLQFLRKCLDDELEAPSCT